MKLSWKASVEFALIAVLCCASFPSFGQSVTYFGGVDCGAWINRNSQTQQAWLTGFLSGMNSSLANPKNDPLAKLISADQIFIWMDNYCQKNPLETVWSGAHKLYRELGNK
jgi:hypothetical protein